jgi:hypothetical protein
VVFDKYAHDLTFKLGLSFKSIVDEFEKLLNEHPSKKQEGSSDVVAEAESLRPSPPEFHLLKLILLHDELAAWAALHLELNWISNSIVREIIGRRFVAQKNEAWKNLAAFLDGCDSAEMRNLVTEAVAEERKIPNPETQIADVTLKLRNQFLDRQIATLTQKAGQPEIPDAQKIEVLREQQKLREQKRSALSQLTN